MLRLAATLTDLRPALDRVRRLGEAYSKSPLPGGYRAHSVRLAPSWERNEPSVRGVEGRLSRQHVLDLARDASDVSSCCEVFLYAMAWGYGDNGYGLFRSNRVVESIRSREKCGEFVSGLKGAAAAGWESGYEYMASHRYTHLGPAFATKILYFVSPETDRSPILDSVVSGWLWRHGVATEQEPIDSRMFDVSQYERFVGFVDRAVTVLKDELGNSEVGDRGFVEYLLFYDRLYTRSKLNFPDWMDHIS